MPLPLDNLSNHPKRITGAIGKRWIARKLLVCQVWVIDDRAGGFNDIDSFGPSPDREFRPLDSRV
jgi:hypothetical protein